MYLIKYVATLCARATLNVPNTIQLRFPDSFLDLVSLLACCSTMIMLYHNNARPIRLELLLSNVCVMDEADLNPNENCLENLKKQTL